MCRSCPGKPGQHIPKRAAEEGGGVTSGAVRLSAAGRKLGSLCLV